MKKTSSNRIVVTGKDTIAEFDETMISNKQIQRKFNLETLKRGKNNNDVLKLPLSGMYPINLNKEFSEEMFQWASLENASFKEEVENFLEVVRNKYPRAEMSDIRWNFCIIQCCFPFKNNNSSRDNFETHIESTHFVKLNELPTAEGNLGNVNKY